MSAGANDVPGNPRPAAANDLPASRDVVPFREALRAWFLISLQTFGGPAGQIAVMQHFLVDQKRWIGQKRFLHALNYCMLLPGPEAQQLAIYTGWLLNGTRGGIAAGTLFVLPGAVAILALSAIYVAFGETLAVAALFAGLAPAVLAIVVSALWRVGKKALTGPGLIVIAVASFIALSVFGIAFPIVIAVAAVIGWGLGRYAPAMLSGHATSASGSDTDQDSLISDDVLHDVGPSRAHTAKVLGVSLLAWGLPMLAVVLLTGPHSVLTTQGMFFTGTALVTFGGAYAVLAYVAQRAVEVYHWLAPGEMVRGLALAETTPGPLIMVVQFVAFVGAYRNPGTLDPWLTATLAALLTTWVTFVPCFMFVFLGAPYVERLRNNAHLSAALTGITAAVVGVIANLAVYFAFHTLFAETITVHWGFVSMQLPDAATWKPLALAIAVIAAVIIFGFKWSVLRTLGICALLGGAAALAGLPLT
ncbi:chromate transporter [Mycobacterium sp. Root265]|uniref:chromate efflux transporter n=1 Tax=Mycobacterium sp. Root265 TaxID=1736504 RepID=UPI0007094F9A|nr:chromate efflux transporter [Mycobacterium sp. Root265]KRD07866.1 chromate transporter [Mycobacterium sp. Root265]